MLLPDGEAIFLALHTRGLQQHSLEECAVHRAHPCLAWRLGQACAAAVLALLVIGGMTGCGGALGDGRRAMARGDFETAARAFRAAAAATPGEPRLWLALGRAEMAAERYPRAREAFEHAARLRPHAALPRVLIGHTWELQRRYDEAWLAYRHATESAPQSAYAWRVLGTRLLRWGRARDAVPALERAAELAPEHAETWNGLGLARYDGGDVEGAERAFRRGIELHPEHSGLRLGLAALLVNAHRFAEALAVYDDVVARSPTFAPAHVGRAILLHELGRPDDAEAAFARAVEVARDPEPYRRRLEEYRRLRARD